MWNRKNTSLDDKTLDRFSEELLRTLEATEVEIHTASSSPFLFRRIRARIEAEQRRQAEETNPWVAVFGQVRQAIPVFALLAVVALVSSLYLHSGESRLPATDNKTSTEQQMTLVAGLPAFLQDAQEDVVASLVGWQGTQPNQRKE